MSATDAAAPGAAGAAAAPAEVNLHKDEVTGEMVSKSCVYALLYDYSSTDACDYRRKGEVTKDSVWFAGADQ